MGPGATFPGSPVPRAPGAGRRGRGEALGAGAEAGRSHSAASGKPGAGRAAPAGSKLKPGLPAEQRPLARRSKAGGPGCSLRALLGPRGGGGRAQTLLGWGVIANTRSGWTSLPSASTRILCFQASLSLSHPRLRVKDGLAVVPLFPECPARSAHTVFRQAGLRPIFLFGEEEGLKERSPWKPICSNSVVGGSPQRVLPQRRSWSPRARQGGASWLSAGWEHLDPLPGFTLD